MTRGDLKRRDIWNNYSDIMRCCTSCNVRAVHRYTKKISRPDPDYDYDYDYEYSKYTSRFSPQLRDYTRAMFLRHQLSSNPGIYSYKDIGARADENAYTRASMTNNSHAHNSSLGLDRVVPRPPRPERPCPSRQDYECPLKR